MELTSREIEAGLSAAVVGELYKKAAVSLLGVGVVGRSDLGLA